jgi:hypothetical protein
MHTDRTTATPPSSLATRLFMGACIGFSFGAGSSISQYLRNSYGLTDIASMLSIGLLAPSLLILFSSILFQVQSRTQPARRWPTAVLASMLFVELSIYLCLTSYTFRPCSWLDLPRRLNGCATATALSEHEFALFFHADTNAGSLITAEDRLLGWLADPSTSPVSDRRALQALAISPAAQLVAFGWRDGLVELRQLTTGVMYAQLPTTIKDITDLTFTPDGQGLLVANDSPTLRLWDIRTQALLTTLTDQTKVEQSAISPDGAWLTTIGDGARLRVWDWQRRTLSYTLPHEANVRSIAFSPDSQYLASGDWDGQIRLWRANDGTLLWQVQAYELDNIERLVFTPDSQLLISSAGNQTRTIRLWSVASGALHDALDQRYAATIAVSADGSSLYTAGLDWLYRWRLP